MSRGDTIWISSLKKGGVAYRSGMLQPGDAILSINGQSLEQRNLREAAQILKDSGDSVVVRVSKDSGEWVGLGRGRVGLVVLSATRLT